MSPRSAVLWSKVTKFKYLNRFSTDLHQTFRTGFVFLSHSKWVQEVLCYDQNWTTYRKTTLPVTVTSRLCSLLYLANNRVIPWTKSFWETLMWNFFTSTKWRLNVFKLSKHMIGWYLSRSLTCLWWAPIKPSHSRWLRKLS